MSTETKTIVSTKYPTPMWFRKVVRAATWVSAIWAVLLTMGFSLQDFGATLKTDFLVLKYMAIFAGMASVVARFIGVKPVKFDTDEPLNKY